ncbi:MAG TPA: hypothetical protein PLZ51_14635 [Aggregatilineales bacterium]|nr:hypothetical protein [Aggregatilineales bacterium]
MSVGVAIILPPMSADEARACVQSIKAKMLDLKTAVYDLWQRQGYIALGYTSFHACLKGEFGDVSAGHLYRLKDAAVIEGELRMSEDSPLEKSLPEAHARQLKLLPNGADRITAYRKATILAKGDGAPRPTIGHVQKAVELVKAENGVQSSPYPVIAKLVANGTITASVGIQMVGELNKLKADVREGVLLVIAEYGLSTPELIPHIADMVSRPADKASYVLPEIIQAGHLGGVPLLKATLTDLENAKYEAMLEHRAEGTEKKREREGTEVSRRVSVMIDAVDMRYTLKALGDVLGDEGMRQLWELGKSMGLLAETKGH